MIIFILIISDLEFGSHDLNQNNHNFSNVEVDEDSNQS